MTRKLFIWHDVLPDYKSGVIFAMADTVDQARQVVLAQGRKPENQWMLRDLAKDIIEEPEVFDEPCAGWLWGSG